MRAGPKRAISVAPLPTEGLPAPGPARRRAWIEKWCTVPRGHGAGDTVALRAFQQEILDGAFAPGVRTALISIPRGNGKTALAAMLALSEIFDGPMSAEVLVVASDQRQAEIVLRLARRMIELNPELMARAHLFRDRIYIPQTDSTLLPLPAEPDALQGYDPTLLIVDELHVVTTDVWEAATTAAGKRPQSLTLAISTPATDRDSVMWALVEHGRENTDPAFFFREWAAPAGCDPADRDAWVIANPALADDLPFLALDAIEAIRRTTRVETFKRLRLGMWVEMESAWIAWEDWAGCADAARVIADKERVALAFDGSASGDSTALVASTLDGHVWPIEIWEHPPGDARWRVPREEVHRTVDAAFDRFEVVELACDPWGWRTDIEQWAARHGEKVVIEWNTAAAQRMAPATDRMYAAVKERRLSHDGDSRLASHIAHCIAKATPMGDLVSKDKKGSPRKIDAAVAAIVAYDRAMWHASNAAPRRRARVAAF